MSEDEAMHELGRSLGQVGPQGLLCILREAGNTIITKRAAGEDVTHDCPALHRLLEYAQSRGVAVPDEDNRLLATAFLDKG